MLNRKGTYNRCKLTKLVVDEEWEKKTWNEAWQKRDTEVDEECVGMANKSKRRGKEAQPTSLKRRKAEDQEGNTWGEGVAMEGADAFLYSAGLPRSSNQLKQSNLNTVTLSGQEWFCKQILLRVAEQAVELSTMMQGVNAWEEWEEQRTIRRESKEEKYLWKMLDEQDREMWKAREKEKKKKAAKVTKARSKLGAGRDQPSILSMLPSNSQEQ